MTTIKPIKPFEPMTTLEIPTADNWVGQVKWDGTRILVYSSDNTTQVFNRNLNERSKQYPELLIPEEYSKTNKFIIDGEVIAFKNGVPSFYEVMKRDRIRNIEKNKEVLENVPIAYMVFDILSIDDKWITHLPLSERQKILREMIIPNTHINVVENFTDTQALFDACIENDLEGVVFKDLNSTYTINGKDRRWLKKKKNQDIIAVIGGVTLNNSLVKSLHLGLYNDQNQLIYIGSVGSGNLTKEDWLHFTKSIISIIREKSPFENFDVTDNVWLDPLFTVKVHFLEWINCKKLRHPTIEAFVSINPEKCRFHQI
ncbi:RNA ligase family protein [Lysinibacillus cavernae]|uniref:ATP-dependent DNA ligase n=1 Tax=Lysinibacillus cavernae TaxID=2666135 RepID=UPI001E444041|nr:RNA ligase family protein [Lysinibacillus cavernae]